MTEEKEDRWKNRAACIAFVVLILSAIGIGAWLMETVTLPFATLPTRSDSTAAPAAPSSGRRPSSAGSARTHTRSRRRWRAAPTPAGSAAARTRPSPAPSVCVAFSHPSDGTRSEAHAQLPAAFHAEPLSGAAQSSVHPGGRRRRPRARRCAAAQRELARANVAQAHRRHARRRVMRRPPRAAAETYRGDRQLTLRPCATASAESPSRAPTICFVGGWMLHP